jgi:hypothetical protein
MENPPLLLPRRITFLDSGFFSQAGRRSGRRAVGLCLLLLTGLAGSVQAAGATEKIPGPVFDVRQFGATGNGRTLDTPAINRAIEACAQAGGGTVLFPAGEYVTGTFALLSHITLQLEAGAVIKGSTNLADYQFKSAYPLFPVLSGYYGEGLRAGLIVAVNADDIGIVGQGTIDMRGTSFVDLDVPQRGEGYDQNLTRQGAGFMDPKFGSEGPVMPSMDWMQRPGVMLLIYGCRNVVVRDVTLKDSHNWTLNLNKCDGIVISGLKVLNNLLIPNNDGINLYLDRHVRISDCYLSCGDDAIAVNFSEDLTVTNCVLISRSSAIRFYLSRSCTFDNLVIRDSNRGIAIYEGAEDVLFSNIVIQTRLFNGTWWGKAEPIHISVRPERGSAAVRNVRFSNITADSEAGILINGRAPGVIRDLAFDHLRLRLKGGANSGAVGGNFDLRQGGDLMTEAVFKHDIPGFYARNVDGLRIQDFTLEWADALPDYFSDGIYGENIAGLTIEGFAGRQAHLAGSGAAVVLKHSRNVTLRNCTAAAGTRTFLAVEDVTDPRLFVDNDLTAASQPVSPAGFSFKVMSGNAPAPASAPRQ